MKRGKSGWFNQRDRHRLSALGIRTSFKLKSHSHERSNKSNIITLYHGAHTKYIPHEGQCYTSDLDSAQRFGGDVGVININLDNYNIYYDVPYDHDTDFHPSDTAEYRQKLREKGYDIIVYDDEDERGCQLTTYRFLTKPETENIISEEF